MTKFSHRIRSWITLPGAALCMALAGCDVHEFPSDAPAQEGVETKMRLVFADGDMPVYTTVEYNSGGKSSRAASDEPNRVRHTVKVYAQSKSGYAVGTEVASATFTDPARHLPADRSVSISLPPGEYTYVVWTDYGNDEAGWYYDATDFSDITLRSEKRDGMYFHSANTHWREAYRGSQSFTVGTSGQIYEPGSDKPLAEGIIEMRRPLAKFIFVATDLEEFIESKGGSTAKPQLSFSDYRVVVRYTGYMPSSFNNLIDKPVNSMLGAAFDGEIATESMPEGDALLGSDYVYAGRGESSVLVALDIYDLKSNRRISSTNPITVPLLRNRLTIVKGKFLTAGAGSDIGVNPDFDGDINIEIK